MTHALDQLDRTAQVASCCFVFFLGNFFLFPPVAVSTIWWYDMLTAPIINNGKPPKHSYSFMLNFQMAPLSSMLMCSSEVSPKLTTSKWYTPPDYILHSPLECLRASQNINTRSLGDFRAPTSSLMPFGLAWLRPSCVCATHMKVNPICVSVLAHVNVQAWSEVSV